MSLLNVFTSSSLKTLLNRFSQQIRPVGPLASQTVVVQSSGMARWISMELALLNGVCANIDYKFPNTVLDDLFNLVIPGSPRPSPFAAEIMTWRIMGLLPDLIQRPGFEPIRHYFSAKIDDRKLLQLSRLIADTFDKYTLFRPELILEWDKNQGEGWQPELWRAIGGNHLGLHRAGQLEKFRARINRPGVGPGLPESIDLFGISYLPPFHLEALNILARVCRVNIYQLNPCGDFWGDIISEKKLNSLPLFRHLSCDAEEYYETGNPLLSSLGTLGQEFFNLLLDYDAVIENLDELHQVQPRADNLLGLIQSDILHLNDRSGIKHVKYSLAQEDHSIQIHSCHSALREMEVLYDNLLQMFAELPDLEPRQIIVMSPDLEAYAPYITAVFAAHSNDRPQIPFTIADRSQRRENPAIETFLRILDLPSSRFGINQILEILESPAVMARFSFASDEIELIREWLRLTEVRWGVDARHRTTLGFPSYAENSWQSAIERMLLGVALPPDEEHLFCNILPCDNIEGRSALTLGKLTDFFQNAVAASSQLAAPRNLAAWADSLNEVINKLMAGDQNSDLKAIFEALQKLRDIQELSGYKQPLALEALRDELILLLEESSGSHGFLGGRVTFCAMLPMRSIPFRVICLTGMNDGVFPRTSRLPGFSLMSGTRRRGDRSLRDEDRYLFLEALLSANERLFISYTGQSNRDNSMIPPSVVVSELLDYIQAGFRNWKGETPDIVRHPLQSFSPEYFATGNANDLFSYSRGICESLKTRYSVGFSSLPFINAPLAEPESDWQEVELSQLLRFFANPTAWFLSRRLGVRPDRPDLEAEEREFFALDSKVGYRLKQQLLEQILAGKETAGILAAARAASQLPPLTAGQTAFEIALAEANAFARRIAPRLTELLDPLPVTIEVGGFKLSGMLSDIRSNHLMRFRLANMKGQDRLSVWIEHLVLNCAAPAGFPRASLLISRDGEMPLPPVADATAILLDLLECYREGLCTPLHFFPESSWLYLKKGLPEAQRRWYGNGVDIVPSESANPSYQLCFERQNPLDEQFQQLAERVYGPLVKILQSLAP